MTILSESDTIFSVELGVDALGSGLITSDGRFPYSKSKIEIFFPKSKKSKFRFYN